MIVEIFARPHGNSGVLAKRTMFYKQRNQRYLYSKSKKVNETEFEFNTGF